MFKVFQKVLCTGNSSRQPKKRKEDLDHVCQICHCVFPAKNLLKEHKKQPCLLPLPDIGIDLCEKYDRTPEFHENQESKDTNFSEPKLKEEEVKMNSRPPLSRKVTENDKINLDLAKSTSLSGLSVPSIQIYFRETDGVKVSRVVVKESKLDEIIEKTKKLNYDQRCDIELRLISMYRKGKTKITYAIAEEWMEKYEQYLNGSGDEFPGQIQNEYLKKKLKKGVIPQNTYAVNELLWKFLQKLYGGGPEITYTEELDSLIFADFDRYSGITTNDTIRKSVRSEIDDSRRISLSELPVSLSPPNKPTSMPNPKLYCYMNSCLQALLSIPKLVEYLKLERYKVDSGFKRLEFWPSMAEVVHAWEKRHPYFIPKRIKQLSANHFSSNQQHDAHEFLIFMLSSLQEEINAIQPPREIVHEDSMSAWAYYEKHHVSLIDKLFAGQMMSKVQCRNCLKISTTYDPFLDLSLPIANSRSPSLDDCLTAFQEEEEIINSYKCSVCRTQQTAIKRLSIDRLPKNLIVQWKRFQTEPVKAKRDDYVEFPVENDWLVNMVKDNRVETYSFALRAVISHSGPIDSGHYVCYSKRGDDWFLCNDEDIRKVTPSDILNKDAYVLIYEQKE